MPIERSKVTDRRETDTHLVNGFRWSFHGTADVGLALSLGMTFAFLVVSLAVVAWTFRTGYRLRA